MSVVTPTSLQPVILQANSGERTSSREFTYSILRLLHVHAFRSGFNLPEFVQTAFKELKSDVELTTDVTMGDYKTTLKYTQPGVPTKTDESLNLILPVLAQPIVQKVVSGSGIRYWTHDPLTSFRSKDFNSIDDVLIIDPQQNSFSECSSHSILGELRVLHFMQRRD